MKITGIRNLSVLTLLVDRWFLIRRIGGDFLLFSFLCYKSFLVYNQSTLMHLCGFLWLNFAHSSEKGLICVKPLTHLRCFIAGAIRLMNILKINLAEQRTSYLSNLGLFFPPWVLHSISNVIFFIYLLLWECYSPG